MASNINVAFPVAGNPTTESVRSNFSAAKTEIEALQTGKQNALGFVAENSANKGVANGYASLGADGKVPSGQLPAYVDEVVEAASVAAFPDPGLPSVIYVALDTNQTYRWGGSSYTLITSGAVSSVAGKTGVVTLTKSDVGLNQVDNTSDLAKPVSTATQTALDLKAPLASPALTGIPTAPTAAVGTNSTQLATTAFVIGERSSIATLTNKTITGAKETRVALAANNIDLATGNYFTKTVSTATTFTVSNVPAAGSATSIILDLTNGGAATVTWWAGVKWAGGTAPTLTAAGRDVLGFFTHDGGTTWTGLMLGKDVR